MEERDNLLALDRRELGEEVVHGISRFEVVEEGLDGDASAGEARRAAEDSRIGTDDIGHAGVVSMPIRGEKQGGREDEPIRGRPSATAQGPACSALRFVDCFGVPEAPVQNTVTDENNQGLPDIHEDGEVCPLGAVFRRGDATSDSLPDCIFDVEKCD